MGQRLNIEIHKGGKVLANAYYHWSAYTSSSLELVNVILTQIDKIKEDNDVVYAIRLLESTGAGITKDELPSAKMIAPEKEFNLAVNRNTGLIAITTSGMEETRYWEEGRVEIDLTGRMINFNVLWIIQKDEFIQDYGEEHYNKLYEYPFDFPFYAIPFDKFNEFAIKIFELINNRIYAVKDNSDRVVMFIE